MFIVENGLRSSAPSGTFNSKGSIIVEIDVHVTSFVFVSYYMSCSFPFLNYKYMTEYYDPGLKYICYNRNINYLYSK